MDIHKITQLLKTKHHNQLYLNRYVRYLSACERINLRINNNYVEGHHILPKAADMFPEYIDTNIHDWNCINLTGHQHVFAHIILWKLFGKSQATAVHFMLNVQYHLRDVSLITKVKYAAKAREAARIEHCGKSTYLDSSGEKYFIETDSPLIEELGLVGFRTGKEHTEESIQKMRHTKYPNKKVKLYFLDSTVSVGLFSEEYEQYIAQGWTLVKTKDDYAHNKQVGFDKISDYWTGRMRYMTPDGVYHGSYLKEDPIITELNLVPLQTDAQRAQQAVRLELATAAHLGTNLWTDDVDEKFSVECPGIGWKLGRAPRSAEWEVKRKAASAKKFKGSTTYTNGLVNMPIQAGDHIPDGFYPGMKKRPNTTYSYTNKDKSVLIQFTGNHEVPADMIRLKGIESIDSLKRTLNL